MQKGYVNSTMEELSFPEKIKEFITKSPSGYGTDYEFYCANNHTYGPDQCAICNVDLNSIPASDLRSFNTVPKEAISLIGLKLCKRCSGGYGSNIKVWAEFCINCLKIDTVIAKIDTVVAKSVDQEFTHCSKCNNPFVYPNSSPICSECKLWDSIT